MDLRMQERPVGSFQLPKDQCICDDETLTKELVCQRCRTRWTVKKDHHERVASCPQHHDSIAICGGGGKLCLQCENDGYYLIQTGWFGSEIKQKPSKA